MAKATIVPVNEYKTEGPYVRNSPSWQAGWQDKCMWPIPICEVHQDPVPRLCCCRAKIHTLNCCLTCWADQARQVLAAAQQQSKWQQSGMVLTRWVLLQGPPPAAG